MGDEYPEVGEEVKVLEQLSWSDSSDAAVVTERALQSTRIVDRRPSSILAGSEPCISAQARSDLAGLLSLSIEFAFSFFGLKQFRKLILVSSQQDGYVPLHSARIEAGGGGSGSMEPAAVAIRWQSAVWSKSDFVKACMQWHSKFHALKQSSHQQSEDAEAPIAQDARKSAEPSSPAPKAAPAGALHTRRQRQFATHRQNA